VSSFPDNTIPVCKVIVGANFITSIQDARDMMFRLGSGGLNPNPLNKYGWREEPSSIYARKEPNTTMTSALDANPFEGGDKNIQSLKEWMDAVMTKLQELGGTTYWYENTSAFNLINVFKDALATSIKSKGTWESSSMTPGLLAWSEDIIIQSTTDARDTIVRAGAEQLQNNEVLYIDRLRNAAINNGSVDVNWYNGLNYVNGSLGAFENLSKGDWIKKADDSDYLYLRVEEFYTGLNLAGGVTSPSNALSIKLSGNYLGASESRQASFSKGIYLSSDVQVSDRSDPAIEALGGNFYWLAMRSDTIMSIASIVTTQLTCDITNNDLTKAKVTSVAHGLKDGQRITFSDSVNFNGTYAAEVEDADTFYISIISGPHADETGVHCQYATVVTQSRSTPNGIVLESANHGFKTDQQIIISGTTNYNSDVQVYVLSSTSFTMPVDAMTVSESAGVATAVDIYVRTDIGPTRLDRGEVKGIGDLATRNLMAFIGMENDVQTYPMYHNPTGYNTLFGQENYNSDPQDNLTQRASKLTAMMADKAQDKTIKYAETFNSINNLTVGTAQVISFIAPATPTLDIILPSSDNFQNTITLTGTLSLEQNQVAYFIIDRNYGFSINGLSNLLITTLDELPLDENVLVFAYRLTGVEVYLYSNKKLKLGGNPLNSGAGVIKVRLNDPISTTLPLGVVIIDGIMVADQDKVLFTNLSSDPNRIYSAVVSAGSVISWTPEYEFAGFQDPSDGDLVIVTEGTLFGDQLAKFDGVNFVFNDKVRYFNGTDYMEQSALYTSTILNNQVTPQVLTSFNFNGSEYSIIEYSISRGSAREAGQLIITTDGTNAAIANSAANTTLTGIKISAVINGTNLEVSYISDNSGSNGEFKFTTRRWSNSPGGPSGLPSYTGGSGSGSVTASGSPLANQITFFTSSSDITGSNSFKINTSDKAIEMDGLQIVGLQVSNLLDAQISPATAFTLNTSLYSFAIIEYSIERGVTRQVGTLMATHDTIMAEINDVSAKRGIPGIDFTADISGTDLRIRYTSTVTGDAAIMKYTIRRWS